MKKMQFLFFYKKICLEKFQDLAVCNQIYFFENVLNFFYFFEIFWRKLGILIPDLYFTV